METISTDKAPAALGPYSQAIKAGGFMTVFISDMNDFAALNAVYAEMFGDTKPARSCVQAARLPKDVKLEIEAVAVDEQ